MSKEIKKRVVDSDIENAKKSSKRTSIIIIIILSIIIIGLVLFLLYDYEIIFPEEHKPQNTKEVKRHEEKDISLNINNPNIINLFNNIHDRITPDGDQVIYNNKSMDTSKMDTDYKFKVAYNIYKRDVVDATDKVSVSESDVKNAYETIFGTNTYKRPETISTSCNELTYDSITESFINTSPSDCKNDNTMTSHEEIIRAYSHGDELYITSAAVFNVDNDNIISSLCKDINCNKVLTKNNGDYTREKHFTDYIAANKDKLQQYTYKYKLDKDGFYYYLGYERTKN